MIIVRIETDIAPLCAPRQLFRTRLPGFFRTNAPLVETLAGAVWLCIGAQEVGGSDVQDITECKEIICFGLAYASLIIADRADGDIKLLRQFLLRQPGGLPCLPDDAGRFGMGRVDINKHLDLDIKIWFSNQDFFPMKRKAKFRRFCQRVRIKTLLNICYKLCSTGRGQKMINRIYKAKWLCTIVIDALGSFAGGLIRGRW